MNMNETRRFSDSDRISWPVLAAFGLGGLIPIALFNIAGQLMPLLLNTGLGISAFWLGVVMVVPRLWDAFSDPMMGHISDNAQTPWGRRRPFVLLGAVCVAVSFVAMWWGPEKAAGWIQLGYVLLAMLLFFTATTVFEIPHGALGMEMVREPHVRTRLFSAKSFCGNMFALGTPWLVWLSTREIFCGVGGNEIDGMRWVSMLIAAILIPMALWWFAVLKEPAIPKQKSERIGFGRNLATALRNRKFLRLVSIFFILAMGFNFVALLNYYISMFYIYAGDKVAASTLLGVNGTVWAVTGLVAVFPLNVIGPKLGKRKTLVLSILLMCAAQVSKIVCYNPNLPYLMLIPTVLLSAGMLMFFTLGPSMLGDLCDEVELNSGRRTDGSFYAVFWWFIKLGTACASLVTGALIGLSTFDERQSSLMDAVVGPLRELSVAGLTDQQDINFNVMTVAVVIGLTGLGLFVFALKNIRTTGRKGLLRMVLGLLIAAGGAALGRHQLHRSDREPAPVEYGVKFAAVSEAVQEADTYFAAQETGGKTDAGHYAELRGLLEEIDRGTARLSEADAVGTLKPGEVREACSALVELALQAMQQSPQALFRLRAIEIALPLFMSAISLFLTFRYPLTEKRIYEIKTALEQRREEQDMTENE